jgi:hypothetical protein
MSSTTAPRSVNVLALVVSPRQGQHVLDQQIRRPVRASLAGASLSLSTLPQAGRDKRSRLARDVNGRLLVWCRQPLGSLIQTGPNARRLIA